MRTDDNRRRVRLNAAYVEAIERAGALPFVVPPLGGIAHAAAIIDACDGLVLTGGEDIDPDRYDAVPDATVEGTNPERDATEIALVEAARARACPTFAICRGLQLLNVALGGSLVQDIPSQRPDALNHDPAGPRSARVHEVEIEHESALARTLGSTRVRVNSFHHQAADRVAEGLRATAWAPDGIIEGLEWRGPADWWALAVQWHPEELVIGPEPAPDTSLFAEFVRRAAAFAARG
jgi:putative glutamine amidotransferase